MKKLSTAKRAQIVHMLVEGNSLRSTARMADVSLNTVTKLLRDMGTVCAQFHEFRVRGLRCKRIQCDEIWAFNYCKDRTVPSAKAAPEQAGSIWTWTAICADSKLIVGYEVGDRGAGTAHEFMQDVAGRLDNRIQITTDGHRVYLDAVEDAFGSKVDYAMLIKLYGSSPEGESRYSPAECIGTRVETIQGAPDDAHVSTSYVERQNLTMRMAIRRFTRLTNGFSKRFENHCHAVALHFMHYNFCRVHRSLRVTPAMEAGIANHVWEIADLVRLLEAKEQAAIEAGSMKRGAYRPRKSV